MQASTPFSRTLCEKESQKWLQLHVWLRQYCTLLPWKGVLLLLTTTAPFSFPLVFLVSYFNGWGGRKGCFCLACELNWLMDSLTNALESVWLRRRRLGPPCLSTVSSYRTMPWVISMRQLKTELGFASFILLPPAGNRILLKTHLETQKCKLSNRDGIYEYFEHCCHLNVRDSNAEYSGKGLIIVNRDIVFI